jgi:hypothetical protein
MAHETASPIDGSASSQRRAKGGAGMIITEIVAVDPAALCQTSTVTGYEARTTTGSSVPRMPSKAKGLPDCSALASGRQQLVDRYSPKDLRPAGCL